MANKFEDMTFDNNDYQVVKNISEDNNTNLGWEKKIKTSFSIKKSNSEKLDELVKKFNAKSSKLTAHFTIKSPFETDNIVQLENNLDKFSKENYSAPYKIKGYDNFDDRVIFMKVIMSKEGKILHDNLIDSMSSIDYINFDKLDGKNKIFHITISSKKIKNIFNDLLNYVSYIPCDFNCNFDNICIYKWENNTWILHKEYLLKK